MYFSGSAAAGGAGAGLGPELQGQAFDSAEARGWLAAALEARSAAETGVNGATQELMKAQKALHTVIALDLGEVAVTTARMEVADCDAWLEIADAQLEASEAEVGRASAAVDRVAGRVLGGQRLGRSASSESDETTPFGGIEGDDLAASRPVRTSADDRRHNGQPAPAKGTADE